MSDSSIFNEINDDMRRQQLTAFWQENGKWIIGGAIFAVVLTGVLTFWRGHAAGENLAATQQLLMAADSDNPQTLESFASTHSGNHAALARLMAAGILARKGDDAGAVAIYDKVGGSIRVDKAYRELAMLLSASHQIGTADPAELHSRLQKLTGRGSVWRFSALETEALLYAREGRMQEAVDTLTKISSDPDAPQDLRTRAFTFRELYMGAAGSQQDEAKKK